MTEGVYQKLGIKTFWVFFVVRRSIVFLVLLFLTVLFVVARYYVDFYGVAQFIDIINLAVTVGFLLTLISFFLVFFIAYLEYVRFKILISPNAFKITKGVLTKEEISLPYRRIQSVDIKQPILYQIFGVSRLTIETVVDDDEISDSKNDDSDEVLPAVDSDLALEIQHELTTRANIQKFAR